MHAEYLKSIFDVKLRNRTVAAIVKILKTNRVKYDTIAVSGVSGITVGSMVAFHLKKRLAIVRKKSDVTHSWITVEHSPSSKTKGKFSRYIIIDDLIDSGDTIKRVLDGVAKERGDDAECVGIVLYDKGVRFKNKDYVSQFVTEASLVSPLEKPIKIKINSDLFKPTEATYYPQPSCTEASIYPEFKL